MGSLGARADTWAEPSDARTERVNVVQELDGIERGRTRAASKAEAAIRVVEVWPDDLLDLGQPVLQRVVVEVEATCREGGIAGRQERLEGRDEGRSPRGVVRLEPAEHVRAERLGLQVRHGDQEAVEAEVVERGDLARSVRPTADRQRSSGLAE